MTVKIVSIVFLMFGAGAVTAMAYSIEDLQDKFDDRFSVVADANGIIDQDIYFIDPFLAGIISMYEATQDDSYIEDALNNVEYLISEMLDVDEDGYIEWPGVWDHDGDPCTAGRAYCFWAQRGVRQFARLVRLIKNDVYLNSTYGQRADDIITIIKHDIINDPYCSQRFEPDYDSVHHIVSHPTTILLELYLAEGDQTYLEGESYTYLETISANANNLRVSLFPNPNDANALVWGRVTCVDINDTYPDCYYSFDNNPNYPVCTDCNGTKYCFPEDVSHAENFIFTAIELYRAGIVFDINDINAFVYTFVNIVWDGNSTDPKYHDFIDGHIAPDGALYLPWKQGSNIAAGWVGLGAFDENLHEVFEAGDTSSVTNKLWLNYLAYYGELARNLVVGEGQYTNNAKEICDGIDNDCDGKIDENCVALYIKNSSGDNIAYFGNFGNLVLADELYPSSSHPATGHDEFRVQDVNGVDVAIIDTSNGKMYIKGTLKLDSEGNWVTPTDGEGNFRIKDRRGYDVAYISKVGDLYLKGKLYEDANP
jgi:hypothetical protein